MVIIAIALNAMSGKDSDALCAVCTMQCDTSDLSFPRGRGLSSHQTSLVGRSVEQTQRIS